MKSTGYKVASSLLAAALVLTPSVPVFAAGTAGTGQIKGLPSTVLVNKGKQVKRMKANGALPASKVQTIHGTVSPLVTSGKAKRVKDTDPNKVLQLGFVLQPRNMAKMTAFATTGKTISQSQYKSEFAPTSASVALVKKYLTKNNIKVASQTDDMLTVEGTAAQFEKLLKIQFNNYQYNNYKFYGTANDPVLPTEVGSLIKGVLGLNETHYSRVPVQKHATDIGANGFFTPDAVRTAYGMMPAYGNKIDGTGRNIAILMTGDYSDNDVKKFSQTFGIPYDAKKIVRKHVPGTPFTHDPELESTLDVEWAHALAPGATISEYETGTLDDLYLFMGIDTILHDSPTVDVINMSFGEPEGVMSPNQLDTWHVKFVEAVAKGITPIAASGDNGVFGLGFPWESVSHPASDPFVLAVGGTSLDVDSKNNRTDETAWGEAELDAWVPGYTWGSGGGYSTVFSDFVDGTAKKRGVPDVSMLGNNIEVYQGSLGGFVSGGGTSFSAPMWSGIVALAAQRAKHGFGWIRPAIDSIAQDPKTTNVFHDITEGNNGGYSASAGWDAVTGWGTPQNGWSLVQALATHDMNKPSTGATISGYVVGDMALSYDQSILNGVGTVDILGSGFGNDGDMNGGTVTLTDANNNTFTVPVYLWTDSDITLNIDSDRMGLFSLPNHPATAGTYTLKVSTANGKTTNTIPVKLGDFVSLTHTGQTDVSDHDNTVYQDVHISVMSPDGTADVNYQSQTGNFYIFSNNSDLYFDPTTITVMQNGQALTPNPDGSYPITISNGADVQVATSVAGDYSYYTEVPEEGIWGGDADPGIFMASDTAGAQLVSQFIDETHLASVGSTNTFDIELQDIYGNPLSSNDHLQVTVKNTDTEITGDVTVNDAPVLVGGAPCNLPLVGNSVALNVSDTVDESFAVVVTDVDRQDTNGQNLQVEVPVSFTKAAKVHLTPDQTEGVTVSQPGQEQAINWQNFTVDVLDNGETQNVPFTGNTFLHVWYNFENPFSVFEVPYHVQEYVQGQWQDLQKETDDWGGDLYKLDLSTGSLKVRVSSPVAGSVSYEAFLDLNSYSEEGMFDSLFTPGAAAGFVSFVQLPHMATSPANTPQYTPVSIGMVDANENGVASSDKVTLTEAQGGPAVTVATLDSKGALKPVKPVNGAWSIQMNPSAANQIYIASAAPGVATFTLADATNTNVKTNDFQVTFVNSATSKLTAKTVAPVVPGRMQTVEADMIDALGQQVVNGSDAIALTIGKHTGTVTVTDADGQTITPDGTGKYVQQARSGAAIFHVTDDKGETLSYSFADSDVPTVKTTSATGQFLTPTKFTISTISKDTLPRDTSVPVTLQAQDSKGNPLGYSKVYVSFAQATNGGSAAVQIPDHDPVSLDQNCQEFTTDANGQLNLTYKTPVLLPNGGVDTIKVQDADTKPKATATSAYTFAAAKTLAMSSATIADTASLKVKEERPVSLTALDSKGNAMPYTGVYLWLDGTPSGGHAFAGTDKKELTSTPTLYYTDGDGKIAFLYDTPDSLPSGGTDTIIAQDQFDHPHVKGTSSYTYASTTYYVFNDKQIEVSGKLPADGTKEITVMAQDKNKKPLGNTTLYLSLSQALNGGSATVGGKALTDKPQPFVTDKDTGLVTITYKAPAQLPAGGIDTIVVQNTPDTKPKLKASDSYTFAAVNGFTFESDKVINGSKVIAANGSLKGSDTQPVTVTVLDTKKQPMANTLVYLSLSQTEHGGSAVVKETDGQTETQTPLTADPQVFATDAEGHIQLLYTAPLHLPGGGVDTITVQDAPKNPHAKLTDTYTFTPIGSIKPVLSNTIAQSGLLKPQTDTHVQAVALDAAGKPMANTYVYVTFAGGVGTVSVDGNNVSDKAAYAAVTNPNGVVDITYTTPTVLPTGKSITIVAGDKSSKSAKSVSFTYSYPKIGAIKGVTTFATKGSMQASGKAEPLIVTVEDTTHQALANVGLELTFTSTGQGGTLNVNGAPVNGKTTVSTNDQGQLLLDYQAAETLTSGVKDTLVIKDPVTGKTLTISYSY